MGDRIGGSFVLSWHGMLECFSYVSCSRGGVGLDFVSSGNYLYTWFLFGVLCMYLLVVLLYVLFIRCIACVYKVG